MIAKFIARLTLFVLSVLLALGNFWFTYGIWPRSWASFCIFGTLSFITMILYVAVSQDD